MTEPSRTERRLRTLAAALAVIQVLALAWWLRLEPVPDTLTSGAWSSLAADAARGIFYRPVDAAGLYGGTRYMPLFFSLQGGLIAAGLDVVAAGRLLMVVSAAVFLSGIFAALRASGVGRTRALTFAALGAAAIAFQLTLASVRGDLLAAGLGLWGWARARRDGGAPLAAGALFAAALLTKFTAGFGLVAAVWHLFRTGGSRAALRLTAATAGWFAGGVALAWIASGGRMAENFAAFSTGDGGAAYALAAPWHAAVQVGRDPVFAGLLVLAFAAAWIGRRHAAVGLWLSAAFCAVVVFASRGTDGTHHLLEWQGATLVLLGAALPAGRLVAGFWGVLAAVLGLALAGVAPSARHFFAQAGRTSPEFVAAVKAARAAAPGPLLSEQALFPLIAGERAVVADAHSLALRLRQDPSAREIFRERVRYGRFAAVVLRRGGEDYATLAAGAAGAAPFYPDFPEDLAAAYIRQAADARWLLYVPRARIAH